jgi:hypothetical protein
MSPPAEESPAWAALLPAGTVWVSRHRRAARRLRDAVDAEPAGSSLAAAASPWALARGPDPAGPAGLRAYVAIPSRQRPVLVASRDPAILRYVADSVLSVPPGTGPMLSMVLTAGMKLLRLRPVWMLAAALRAGGVVLVGRSR